MHHDRLIKIKPAITVSLPDGWRAKVIGIDDCLARAVKALASGDRPAQLRSAWVAVTLALPGGRRQRVRLNLLAQGHDICGCDDNCGFKQILLTTMQALLQRERRRTPAKPEARPASAWPYTNAL